MHPSLHKHIQGLAFNILVPPDIRIIERHIDKHVHIDTNLLCIYIYICIYTYLAYLKVMHNCMHMPMYKQSRRQHLNYEYSI